MIYLFNCLSSCVRKWWENFPIAKSEYSNDVFCPNSSKMLRYSVYTNKKRNVARFIYIYMLTFNYNNLEMNFEVFLTLWRYVVEKGIFFFVKFVLSF